MSKFLVNFLMDGTKPQACWVVDEDNPTQIIEAAWADEISSPGCTVQPFSHPDLNGALAFYWQVIQEYQWKHLDTKQIQQLERLLFA